MCDLRESGEVDLGRMRQILIQLKNEKKDVENEGKE